MVSSPVIGTFNPPRNAPSPGPNTAARPQSSRAQQNNSQATNGRQRPSSSASNRVSNSSTFPGSGPALVITSFSNVAPFVDKPTETKTTAKEGNSKGETASQPSPDLNREATVDAANAATPKMASSAAPKREDTEVKTAEPVQASEPAAPAPPPPPGTATKARSSKTSTPAVSAFSESNQQRPRPSRNTDAAAPVKRSHKKGGALAVTQSNAAGMEDEESSREGDDEEDEGEPRYCYCNDFSFGEMVACDNDACPREWFHLSCVGLTKPPGKNGKWSPVVMSIYGCRLLTRYVCSQVVLQRVQGEHEARTQCWWEVVRCDPRPTAVLPLVSCILYKIDDHNMGFFWRIVMGFGNEWVRAFGCLEYSLVSCIMPAGTVADRFMH